jgi:hypothetical protein
MQSYVSGQGKNVRLDAHGALEGGSASDNEDSIELMVGWVWLCSVYRLGCLYLM